MLKLSSSTPQVRKGEVFKLYCLLTAEELLSEITILPNMPSGFDCKWENEQELPAVLDKGSSFASVWTVIPPAQVTGWLEPGGDTREKKVFLFNTTYKINEHQVRQAVDLTLDYSISHYLYIICGMLGIILGVLIKTLAKSQELRLGWEAAVSVAIGFIVLLVLSRDRVPTKGWYDSIALGAAVAFLSDDKLLSKITEVVPK